MKLSNPTLLSKEDCRKKISIVSVGPSGAGKSTIGNQLLFESPKNSYFKTGNGPNGVTSEPSTLSESFVLEENPGENDACEFVLEYTDLPGLPDPDPQKTKNSYNHNVACLRRPHSAIFYVFAKGRVDEVTYKRTQILLRELNNAQGEKILVINDHHQDDCGSTAESECTQQAEKIARITGIDFTRMVFVNGNNMKSKLRSLVASLDYVQDNGPITHLNDFDEMKAKVRKLVKRLQADKARLQVQLRRSRKEVVRWIGMTGAVALATTGVFVASFFTFGETLPVALAGYAQTMSLAAQTGCKHRKKIAIKNLIKEKECEIVQAQHAHVFQAAENFQQFVNEVV